jgi:hypothetical protein
MNARVCVLAPWMVMARWLFGGGKRAVRPADDLAGQSVGGRRGDRGHGPAREASHIVYLRERADVSAAHGMTDRAAWGR